MSASSDFKLDNNSATNNPQKDAQGQEHTIKTAKALEEKHISTTWECGKCKQKRVAYIEWQTRPGNEPMTVFCECQFCGNSWKFEKADSMVNQESTPPPRL